MLKKTTHMISTISLFLLISSTALYASGHPTEKRDEPTISHKKDSLCDAYRIRNGLLSVEYSNQSLKTSKVPVADYSDPHLKKDPISTEGYAGTRWGMSKGFVNCIFPDNRKENDDLLTINESQFAGIRSNTTLHFVYDMLFRVVIFFNMKLSSTQKGSLEDYLFEKYGIAELLNDGEENIEIQWEQSDTLINYIHYGETDSTVITFKSKTIDKAFNAPQRTPLYFLNGGKVIK